jgi:hypothetical protein
MLRAMVGLISQSEDHCSLFAQSAYPEQREKFTDLLDGLRNQLHCSAVSGDLYSDFVSYCQSNRIPQIVTTANEMRRQRKAAKDQLHRDIKKGLQLSPRNREEYLQGIFQSIPTYKVSALSKPYPPIGHWMYESDEIADLWRYHLEKGKQPDARIKRKPLMYLDPEKLVHDLKPDQSGLFFGEDGDVDCYVLRNFCKDNRVLVSVDNTIKENVGAKKSIRVSFCVVGECNRY